MQIVIESEDRQPIRQESGFAVDDISFADCAYPESVNPGDCGVQESQCNAGECYPTAQRCDLVRDCCDNSDENPATCGT